MNEKFVNVQKKAIQYWFIDGLAELAAGLVGFFLAVLFWVWQDVFTWRWSLPVILVAAFTVSFGLRLIIQRIKERTTYPRTGYVSPFSGLESKWSVVILIAFSLVMLGLNYFFSTKGSKGFFMVSRVGRFDLHVYFCLDRSNDKTKTLLPIGNYLSNHWVDSGLPKAGLFSGSFSPDWNCWTGPSGSGVSGSEDISTSELTDGRTN